MRDTGEQRPRARSTAGASRRKGPEASARRELLLDAAERVLMTEGYAAVTSRRVGREAGVTSPLLHYYFANMDELFVAVFRRRAAAGYEQLRRELQGDRPLEAMWRHSEDPARAVFSVEFAAASNHRPAVRAEVAHWSEQVRALQLEAFRSALRPLGLPEDEWPPEALLLAMTGIEQLLALERNLGVTGGHEQTRAFVQHWLSVLSPPPSS